MRIAVSRSPNAERVTPLELFFDLVYVFAIGQISHHLLEHVDLRTAIETVILALAVFYAWYMTAWGANWLEPDRLPVQLLLIGPMFASLLMSRCDRRGVRGRAWLFVASYLLLQIGRAVFLIVALRGRALGEHFVNVLVWELLVGCLSVAGAMADGTARLMIFPIVLGESVVTAGNAFTDELFEVKRLLALAIGFIGTVASRHSSSHVVPCVSPQLRRRSTRTS
jgi:low temperature requirement protein LtrA